ncbi:hypothetical protein IAU60_003886 [Kwoniella sp. DSM 27419]
MRDQPKQGVEASSPTLSLLFQDQGHFAVLQNIFSFLDIKDISRLIQVNKHVNQTFSHSSHLQLRYRRVFHSVAEADYKRQADVTSGTLLETLLEREERFESLEPSSITCLHIPNAVGGDVEAGYMILGEVIRKTHLHGVPDQPYEVDGWSIWKLDTAEDDEMRNLGATKKQGLWRWKTDFGQPARNLVMCPADNVVAVHMEMKEEPCDTITENSSSYTYHRIYFFTMIPPEGTKPPKDTFSSGIQRPEAKLPFVEIRVDARWHLHQAKIKIAPGGKIGLIARNKSATPDPSYLAFWNWKTGECLGKIASTGEQSIIDDFEFFGPFVLATVIRALIYLGPSEEADHQARTSDHGSTAHQCGKSASDRSRPKDKQQKGAAKTCKGDHDHHKDPPGQQVISTTRPRIAHFFACLEVYQLFEGGAGGCQPMTTAHNYYSDDGYRPSEPCTWRFDSIPACAPLISMTMPHFNPLPIPDVHDRLSSLFLAAGLDAVAEMMAHRSQADTVQPEGFKLSGPIHIDDALLKGERVGVIKCTVLALLPVRHEAEPPIPCRAIVDIREIISRITLHLLKRAETPANEPADLEGATPSSKIDILWSRDITCHHSLLQHIGWNDSMRASKEDQEWKTLKVYTGNVSAHPDKGHRCSVSYSVKGQIDPNFHVVNDLTRDPRGPRYVPWERWCQAVSIRPDHGSLFSSRHGSKVVDLEYHEDLIGMTFGTSRSVPSYLIIRDYNPKVIQDIEGTVLHERAVERLHRPLGSLPCTKKPAIASLLPTDVRQCPLRKPIMLPELSGTAEHSTSFMDDKEVDCDVIFEQAYQSFLPFKEVCVKMITDGRRLVDGIRMDNKRIILYMPHGAHILTF